MSGLSNVKWRGIDSILVYIDENLKLETLGAGQIMVTVLGYRGGLVSSRNLDSADYIIVADQDVAQVSCIFGR